MEKINLKALANSDIKSILGQYPSKPILYKFLIHIVKNAQKRFDTKKYLEVYKAQSTVLELLGDLLLGKEVSKKQLDAAAYAAANAAYAAANAAELNEYKHYLIQLILEENNINQRAYSLLYVSKHE